MSINSKFLPRFAGIRIETYRTAIFTAAALFAWPMLAQAQTLPPVGGTYVMPVYNSSKTGQRSYIRIYNPSTKSGTAVVYLFESGTGTMLGKWTKTIPSESSIQTEITDIEKGAVPVVTPSKDYTAYVNATFNGFVQHVVWNDRGGALTNLTNCGRDTADNGKALPGASFKTYQATYTVAGGTGGQLPYWKIYNFTTKTSIDIMGSPVDWSSNITTYVQRIVDKINAYVSVPEFTAVADGIRFTVTGGTDEFYGGTVPSYVVPAASAGAFTFVTATFVPATSGVACGSSSACLGNVHSSLISQYPSFLQIYNPGVARTLKLTLIDSITGSTIGTPVIDIAATSSNTVTIASLEQKIGLQPRLYHYNVRTESGFTGYATHFVNNLTAGVLTNMTDKCVINSVTAP